MKWMSGGGKPQCDREPTAAVRAVCAAQHVGPAGEDGAVRAGAAVGADREPQLHCGPCAAMATAFRAQDVTHRAAQDRTHRRSRPGAYAPPVGREEPKAAVALKVAALKAAAAAVAAAAAAILAQSRLAPQDLVPRHMFARMKPVRCAPPHLWRAPRGT